MQRASQSVASVVPLSGNRLPEPDGAGAFVVNLGSSSTPVALSEPKQPELKGFKFFISRRREDGRERFRLHMGYFASQQDAETMLDLVRDIYPGAWAGVAPGRKPPEQLPVPAAEVSVLPATPPAVVPSAAGQPSIASAAEAVRAPQEPQELQLEIEPPPPLPDEHFAATQSLHSVRAAIAALDDNSRAPALTAAETLQLLESPAEETQGLSPASIIPTPGRERVATPTVSPEAIAAYAVQLRLAAQPIGLSELPPLAIFDAYTLYRARGTHEGSHWHALRLGFFTDLVSAEQVASYIRPEFSEVTVVPVGAAERSKAQDAAAPRAAPATAAAAAAGRSTAGAKPAPGPAAQAPDMTGQFKLIDDSGVKPPVEHSKLEMMLTSDPAPAVNKAPPAGKGPSQKTRRPPANLEETLDVLGAGNLKLDGAKGEMLDASGVRRMRHAAERKAPPRSSLSRLFDRLAERMGAR